jgi:hypothetical protein
LDVGRSAIAARVAGPSWPTSDVLSRVAMSGARLSSSFSGRSKLSDQTWTSSAGRTSRAVTRQPVPARRSEPSTM